MFAIIYIFIDPADPTEMTQALTFLDPFKRNLQTVVCCPLGGQCSTRMGMFVRHQRGPCAFIACFGGRAVQKTSGDHAVTTMEIMALRKAFICLQS